MKNWLFLISISFITNLLGQTLIKNIAPGTVSSNAYAFYKFDNTRTIFFGNNGNNDMCLFITDGSLAGTFNLAILNTFISDGSCSISNTYNHANKEGFSKIDQYGYILGNTAMLQPVLIRTDGSISGTISFPFNYPNEIINLKCSRFFKMSNQICWLYYADFLGAKPKYLFRYDLTNNSVNYVALNQISTASIDSRVLFCKKRYNTGIDDLLNEDFFKDVFTDGSKFFCVNQGFSGSDTLVSFNINGIRSVQMTYPSEITPEDDSGILLNNKFLFSASNAATSISSNGREPYYYDISSNNISILKDINPYFSYSSNPVFLPFPYFTQGFNHQYLYFHATHADYGREMWVTDGTTAGTQIVSDFVAGPSDGSIEIPNKFYYLGDSIISTSSINQYPIFIKPSSIIQFPDFFASFMGGEKLSYAWSNNAKLYFITNFGKILAPPYTVPIDTLDPLSCTTDPYLLNEFSIIESNGCLIFTQNDCNFTGYEPFIYCNPSLYTAEIDEPSLQNVIQVYPNPTADMLNISLDNQEVTKVFIYNVFGAEIMSFKSVQKIDISGLSSGQYLLHIILENGRTMISKFTKLD